MTREAAHNCAASQDCISHLVEETLGLIEFEGDTHSSCLEHWCMNGGKCKDKGYESERRMIRQTALLTTVVVLNKWKRL
eukprot:14850619-Ditylum_brightwellii.AAC.1